MRLPKVRTAKITVRELADETLVYDEDRKKAHCLNGTAAIVWRHCDGQTTVSALAAKLRTDLGIAEPEEVIRLALEQLSRRHLLEQPLASLPDAARAAR